MDVEQQPLLAKIASLEAENARLRRDARADSDRLAVLVEAERMVGMGTWVWDLGTSDVFWSHGLFRLLGYDPDVDVASVDAFFGAIHPDDRARVAAASARGVESGTPEAIAFRTAGLDGSARYVMMQGAFLLGDRGSPVRAVRTCIDVSASREASESRQRSELVLSALERLAHVGTWSYDIHAGVAEWNAGMYVIFGVDEALSIEAFFEMIHPDDAEWARPQLMGVGTIDEETVVTVRIVRPDGAVRTVLLRTGALGASGDGGRRVVGVALDITERAVLEQQLQQARKMEALGRLAGGIAHDFNNLLTAIRGNAELLIDYPDDREAINDIIEAAVQATSLTRQLLAFSRRRTLRTGAVELDDVVARAISLVKRVIGEDVRVFFTPGAPGAWVPTDAAQVHQVLLNIAANARDAMAGGGDFRLWTGVGVGPDGEERVRLCGRDSGVGMDASTLARAFEPFFTTKGPDGRDRSSSGSGTGLGLSTVFGIVRQAGGDVELDSLPGRGTEVRVFFPRVHAVEDRVVESEPQMGAVRSGSRVLVVEDEPAVRSVVVRYLQRAGYAVLSAGSAEDALRIDAPYEVLVTDLVMPGGSGSALAAELRARHPDLPVLYMTGYAPDSQGELDGPVLLKPFSQDDLLRRLRHVLDA